MMNDVKASLIDTGSNAIHFLLVPESGAARRIRRRLVEESARSNTVIGTYHELLVFAAENFMVQARTGFLAPAISMMR